MHVTREDLEEARQEAELTRQTPRWKSARLSPVTRAKERIRERRAAQRSARRTRSRLPLVAWGKPWRVGTTVCLYCHLEKAGGVICPIHEDDIPF